MRGSDPDAAVYYLARMLYAGESVTFIARRMMICASEDVGNADPTALQVAVSASLAAERVGMPEAQIILAQGGGLHCMRAEKQRSGQRHCVCNEDGGRNRKSGDSGAFAGCPL